jgi:outer membrane protein assembly factor BamB
MRRGNIALALAGLAILGAMVESRAADPTTTGAGSVPPQLRTDWPSHLGPNGNFSESSGARLIANMPQARLLWENLEHRIGWGKTTTGFPRVSQQFGDYPPGGITTPIVAGGAVIVSYFIPSGSVHDEGIEGQLGEEFLKSRFLVAADDAVVALDAATGKTRWKQVFADSGVNLPMSKRGGWGITPAAADGRVFAMGTTGRVHALDLASGELLWQSTIGPAHQELAQLKSHALAEKRLLRSSNTTNHGALLVVGGVLVAPDLRQGLVGFDPATGKQLWRLSSSREADKLTSGYNSPVPARIDGQQYLVTVNRNGSLRLIRPNRGEIVWTHELKSQHLTTPVFGDELLLVFDPSPTYRRSEDLAINDHGVLAAYRLTEQGATRVWSLPGEHVHSLHKDAGPHRRVIPRDGLVYYLLKTGSPEKVIRLMTVREMDGRILHARDVDATQFYLWGDRVITVSDITHRPRLVNREVWQMYTAGPDELRSLGSGWWINNPAKMTHVATGGYEWPIWEAFADGLAFFRVMGGIRCYDLRKPGGAE